MSGNWFAQKALQIIWPWLNFQREVGGIKKTAHTGESDSIYFWQAYRKQNYGAITLMRHVQEKQQFKLDSE